MTIQKRTPKVSRPRTIGLGLAYLIRRMVAVPADWLIHEELKESLGNQMKHADPS
jgi:hypothetical protein